MVSEAAANRQECHERLRQHSHEAAAEIKLKGLKNNLLDKLLRDDYFAPIHSSLPTILDPSYMIGRAVEQVELFLETEVDPALHPYKDCLQLASSITI
nr:adenylosuccinate lyase [Schistosoma japonicum]